MDASSWFSTKLRFAVMVEPEGARILNDCVFLLRASNFGAALERAIAIGEASQKKYRNNHGQHVHWKFAEVISLDMIRSETLDGCEVHSDVVPLKGEELLPFDAKLDPRASKPVQTI